MESDRTKVERVNPPADFVVCLYTAFSSYVRASCRSSPDTSPARYPCSTAPSPPEGGWQHEHS